MKVYSSILDMVGGTPMLEITQIDTGRCRLFVKLELMNPGGSLKDRITLSMVAEAERRGDLKPGDTIVEATSGNTGIGLAMIAARKGYRLLLVIPDKMSQEKIFNLQAMGAEIMLTRSDVNKGHPEYYMDLGKRIAEENGYYFIDQFSNPDNPLAHERTTAPEIFEQLDDKVDTIVMGAGSSGTVTGICAYLNKRDLDTEIALVDPAGSILAEYVTTGRLIEKTRGWLVEGLGKDFVPSIADFSRVRTAYIVDDAEAFAHARELLAKEGLMAGSSTGAVMAASLRYCREQTEAKNVVTFACDTGNRYLTKLYNDFWMLEHGFIRRKKHDDLRDLILRPHSDRATITVGPGDSITTAHNRLRDTGVSQLPVLEDDRLIGVITEEAIIRRAYGHNERLEDPVVDAMQREVMTLDRKTTVDELVSMLDSHPYVAILDGEEFLGLITRADVLNYMRLEK
jgi:cystathionine beta-synthase